VTQETGRGWYQKAVHLKLPVGDNDPGILPALAILHVAVTDILSLFSFFRFRSGGIESHFYIRKDGTVEQYRSVLREADANLGANSYMIGGVSHGAVSIETAGFGGGWWNKAQKQAIKELLLWLHNEHGIALKPVLTPNPSKQQGGVSYHTRFTSWSPVAKSCPGPNRIKQYKTWLRPWMADQRNCLHCPVHCPKEV
jgi:hypothetical protein